MIKAECWNVCSSKNFHKMWHFLYHLCNFKYFSRPVNCHFWVVKRRALYKCHSLTDYSEPLITYSDELSFEPGIIFDCIKAGELATRLVDHTMVHIWVLGGRVVAPDDHILHMGGRNATAHRHLQDRSIKGKKANSGSKICSDKSGSYKSASLICTSAGVNRNEVQKWVQRSTPESELCCGPDGWGRRSSLWGWREQTWLQSDSWCWQDFPQPAPENTHTHENRTDITQHKLIIVIDSLTITDSILEAAVVFFFLS